MKINDIEFGDKPLFLAPMEDVTDPAFRLLCKGFGADMVYTEFVSADALIRSIRRTEQKLTIHNEERPVAIQIYGRDVDTMVEAAKIVEQAAPDIIDLNFGCPVKKVAGKGAGAGMLRNIPLLLDITRAVVNAVKTPVTVKTRLGWDDSQKVILSLAEAIQDCGAQAIAIHGRTRAQMYTGEADWTLIGEVKNNPRMHIPVIGNGDITTPEGAAAAFERYGVDAVMIGPRSYRLPVDIPSGTALSRHREQLPPLSRREMIDVLKTHVLRSIDWLDDERKGIVHSRRHIAASPAFKAIDNFRPTRIAMLRAETLEELFPLMESVADYDI